MLLTEDGILNPLVTADLESQPPEGGLDTWNSIHAGDGGGGLALLGLNCFWKIEYWYKNY